MGLRLYLGLKFGAGAKSKTGAEYVPGAKTGAEDGLGLYLGLKFGAGAKTGAEDGAGAKTGAEYMCLGLKLGLMMAWG